MVVLKLPSAYRSSLEDFEKAVRLIQGFADKGKVKVKVSAGSNLTLEVNQEVLEKESNQIGLQEGMGKRILGEVSTLINVALRDNLQSFTAFIIDRVSKEDERELTEEDKSEVSKILKSKIDLVDSEIITDRIKQRFYYARAVKHQRVGSIQWEIVEKRYDSEEEEKVRSISALLKLNLVSKPEPGSVSELFELDVEKTNSIIIECDEDEIEGLVDTLNLIKEKLLTEREKGNA